MEALIRVAVTSIHPHVISTSIFVSMCVWLYLFCRAKEEVDAVVYNAMRAGNKTLPKLNGDTIGRTYIFYIGKDVHSIHPLPQSNCSLILSHYNVRVTVASSCTYLYGFHYCRCKHYGIGLRVQSYPGRPSRPCFGARKRHIWRERSVA